MVYLRVSNVSLNWVREATLAFTVDTTKNEYLFGYLSSSAYLIRRFSLSVPWPIPVFKPSFYNASIMFSYSGDSGEPKPA